LKPPADIPGVPQIVYRGEFPYAWLTYTAPDNIPVRLRLTAFTPFVPHDAEASAFPAAVLEVALDNRAADPASAAIAFFMPAAMLNAGGGPEVLVQPVTTGGLSGATIATKPGAPARTERPIRVLLITDQPAGERQRVADVLARVSGVRLEFCKLTDDRVVLPRTAEDLRHRYDVIWLAELGRARDRLTQEGMEKIRDAVKAGCGFFYTGGWDSFYGHDENRWARLNGTPIEEIMPVTMLNRWDAVDRPAAAKIVSVPDELKAADLQQFPGVGGYNEIASLKPGAQVVLQTSDGKPLLVLGQYGAGRVAVYLSTCFGGWPRDWRGWPNFYGSLVAYLAGVRFVKSTGTPSDDPAAGSITIAAIGDAKVRRWSELRAAWSEFSRRGDLPAGDGPGVVVIRNVEAPPGQQCRATFVLSWHFPNHRDRRGKLDGNRYASVFTSSRDVAVKLFTRLDDLTRRTLRFHNALYDSPLPYWLADAINAQLATFVKASWWDRQGRFGIWEGMNCCCGLHTVDVSFYGSWPLLMMFPELQKDALRLTAKFQRQSDGRIPHLFAGTFDAIDGYGRIDLPIQFILPVYREYLFTGDLGFLKELWPACKQAANSVFLLDKNNDGLPEHTQPGDQTYDGWAIMGESAYIGSIWLAGLRAMEQMALVLGDQKAAADYRSAFQKAQATFERLLWNGTYYRLWQDPLTGQKDDGLMLDGMCGQWYAHMLGLGWILPRERVISHLKACLQYNRVP
ncbi:MAG: hypothetical protein H5T86_13650, partial [Armatimonadetes bacterium]|nr:hypothetical protein [Armatimonadota bacterium]